MENGVQFTGLNKKWWLLSGATILLFLVSLVILQLGQRTGNLTAVAGNVSRQLDKQEKDFYRLLDNDNLLRRVATDSYTNEDLELLTQKPYSHIVIDDLGYEDDSQLVLWGNKENVVVHLTDILYQLYQSRKIKIYITSNIPLSSPSGNDILSRYGKGTHDRLAEMTTPVLWAGNFNYRTGKSE